MAATAPTDRSIPRVAMTSVIPKAMSRTGAVLRAMSTRFPNRCPSWIRTAKNEGSTARLMDSSTTSATTGQNSGRDAMSRTGGLLGVGVAGDDLEDVVDADVVVGP